MISRVLSENIEATSYPLVSSLTYPPGLIASASFTLDEYCDVFLESVTVTDNAVSVVFSRSTQQGKGPLGYGYTDDKTSGIVNIVSEITGDIIGFVMLGTLSDDICTYSGSVQVLSSCIHVDKTTRSTISVNGKHYDIPSDMDILVSGYLDTENNKVYNKFPDSGSLLDSSSVDLDGGINSVNGTPSEGTIVIDMPVIAESDVPLFMVDVDNYSSDYLSITIASNENAKQEHLDIFTCPSSDILLDKITTGTENMDDIESPLDAFISWYKQQDYSNNGRQG